MQKPDTGILFENGYVYYCSDYQSLMLTHSEQGHHRNGDQAAQRPRMMCSICQSVVADMHSLGLGYVWGRGCARSVARP